MSGIELIGPHFDRPTRFLELFDHGGWRLKTFAVAYGRDTARRELVDAAQSLAARQLPQPAFDGSRYGVGFIVVHDGRGGNWVLIDWWANDNELNQLLYESSDDAPLDLKLIEGPLIACVHEMKVVVHEYEAWLRSFLTNPTGPDLDAYLQDTEL